MGIGRLGFADYMDNLRYDGRAHHERSVTDHVGDRCQKQKGIIVLLKNYNRLSYLSSPDLDPVVPLCCGWAGAAAGGCKLGKL